MIPDYHKRLTNLILQNTTYIEPVICSNIVYVLKDMLRSPTAMKDGFEELFGWFNIGIKEQSIPDVLADHCMRYVDKALAEDMKHGY